MVPEEKLEYPARTTGRVYLNTETCIGCTLCEQICPNGTIRMVDFHFVKKYMVAMTRDASAVPAKPPM